MRPLDAYANYSRSARIVAKAMDDLLAPILGPAGDGTRTSSEPLPAGGPPTRILLIRPDHAGDLLLATPAIASLRAALPEATIDVLASPWGAPALAGNPDLDRVRTIEATWFEPGRREGPDPIGLLSAVASLRTERYDAAADLRGDFRSILIARATGARRRVGFGALGLEALLTDRVRMNPRQDFIGRNHAIVARLGAGPLGRRRPVFVVPSQARVRAAELLSGQGRDRQLLAVFPGGNRPGATWGASRFAAACKALNARRAIRVILGGREADAASCAALARELRDAGIETLDLSGATSLAEAGALIESSSAMLGNDSGASHLAVAVGTPVVAIFGPTDPALLWTWDQPERYMALYGPTSCRRPCFRAGCRETHGYPQIDPEVVGAHLERLILLRAQERP